MARSRKRKRVSRGKRSAQASIAKRSELAREHSLAALAAIRRGSTLSLAARENGVTPRTIKRYVGTALVQVRRGGRIRAAKSDRLVRYLVIPGPHGPMDITVRGSKTASEFAKYKAAVNRFLRGDRNAMSAWHGRKIAGIELITAGGTLKSLADNGLLPYSLYRTFSGGGR